MKVRFRGVLFATAVGVSMLSSGIVIASQKAQINDLVGRDAIKSFDIMTARGFKSVETFTTPDDYIVTWWYNAATGQCVNTQTHNDRVTSASEDKDPSCTAEAGKSGNSQGNAHNSSKPSARAVNSCISRFGHNPQVKSFTALKPGWWEIILQGNKGRKVACTANDDGSIDDWVEMR